MNFFRIYLCLLAFAFFSACEKEDFSPTEQNASLIQGELSDVANFKKARDAWMFFNKGENTGYVWHSSSQTGTSWSTNVKLGNEAKTNESPEAIMYRGQAFVFYRGENLTKKIFYSRRGPNTSWGPEGAMESPIHIINGPTPAVYNNRLYVFFLDQQSEWESIGGVKYFVSNNGYEFNGPYNLPTGLVGDAAINNEEVAAVADRFGRLWVFYVADDSRIHALPCTADNNGILDSGFSINTNDKTKNGLSAVLDPNTNEIVYVHTSYSHDNVMERRVTPIGTTLDLSSSAEQILGARSSRKPSIKTDEHGNFVVVYRGRKSSKIYWSKYLASTGNWTGNLSTGVGKTKRGMGLVYTGW